MVATPPQPDRRGGVGRRWCSTRRSAPRTSMPGSGHARTAQPEHRPWTAGLGERPGEDRREHQERRELVMPEPVDVGEIPGGRPSEAVSEVGHDLLGVLPNTLPMIVPLFMWAMLTVSASMGAPRSTLSGVQPISSRHAWSSESTTRAGFPNVALSCSSLVNPVTFEGRAAATGRRRCWRGALTHHAGAMVEPSAAVVGPLRTIRASAPVVLPEYSAP